MSRLAKKLVTIPSGVNIENKEGVIIIKGKNVTLQHKLHYLVLIDIEDNHMKVTRKNDSKLAKAIQGTTFAILNNHIKGVTEGFTKKLQLHGVGFKAKVNNNQLELNLGKSHVIIYQIPANVKVETPSLIEIIIYGADKQSVGQVAAEIRRFRKPERYKGKGIRYFNEIIILKEAKSKKK